MGKDPLFRQSEAANERLAADKSVMVQATRILLLKGVTALLALGLIAAIWAEKFDEMAAFQNFLIMPLTFLAGVFYSVHSLPAFWLTVSHLNPFFYMVDGFRYGFFGVADVPPATSLAVVVAFFVAVAAVTLALLRSGWKLRH